MVWFEAGHKILVFSNGAVLRFLSHGVAQIDYGARLERLISGLL